MITESSSQVKLQKLEKIISAKVRSAVENVVVEVETWEHDAFLSAIENLVIPRIELAKRPQHVVPAVLLNSDERYLSEDTNGLLKTALGRFNSNTNLNKIDEAGGLPVSEKTFTWKHTLIIIFNLYIPVHAFII